MEDQEMKNPDMHLLALCPLHSDSSRSITEEQHKGHNNASLNVFLMSHNGLRTEKFERFSSGIATPVDQVPNFGVGPQHVLNLNDSRSTPTNTTLSMLKQPRKPMITYVTTQKPAPENIVTNNFTSPRRSTSEVDEANLHLVLKCKNCGGKYKEKDIKAPTLEEWLHSAMCSACQNLLNKPTKSPLQNPNQNGDHRIEEEEKPNSCCLC